MDCYSEFSEVVKTTIVKDDNLGLHCLLRLHHQMAELILVMVKIINYLLVTC